MTFKEFIIDMVTTDDDNGISSKRVMGTLGWFTCLFICIWCVVMGTAAPVIIETLFYCTAALLGLDSITSIWKHRDVKDSYVVPEDNKKPKKEK